MIKKNYLQSLIQCHLVNLSSIFDDFVTSIGVFIKNVKIISSIFILFW